jgi:hypothetical protein
MARGVRFVPEVGALVEVTVRTRHSRLVLRPSPALNEIVIGVLGRAQKRYGVLCCSVVFVSTHWHALLWVHDDGGRLRAPPQPPEPVLGFIPLSGFFSYN